MHEQKRRGGEERGGERTDEQHVPDDVRERALGGSPQRGRDVGDEAIEHYGPVDISLVGENEAKELVHRPVAWMGALMGDVDAFGYGQMTRVAIEMILDGSCRSGLDLDVLADRSKVGRGRLGERFREPWHEAGGVALRALFAYFRRRALYEEISSLSPPTRRRDPGPGTDKHRRIPRSRRFLVLSIGGAGRVVPEIAIPFTYGTPDDHTSDRADAARIARFTRQLGHALPGTPAEHIAIILERRRNVRARVMRASLGRPDLLGRHGLSAEALDRAFSPLLLIPELDYGAPTVPYRSSLGTYLPGLDPALVETVEMFGRRGVLACGTLAEGEQLGADFEVLAPMQLPWAQELGISVPFGVEYLWSRSRELVARRIAGRGTRTEVWRLVGFTPPTLRAGIALIERHAMGWTLDCLERWVADCGPGLIRAYSAHMIEGAVDVLNMANAVLIEAFRQIDRPGGPAAA